MRCDRGSEALTPTVSRKKLEESNSNQRYRLTRTDCIAWLLCPGSQYAPAWKRPRPFGCGEGKRSGPSGGRYCVQRTYYQSTFHAEIDQFFRHAIAAGSAELAHTIAQQRTLEAARGLSKDDKGHIRGSAATISIGPKMYSAKISPKLCSFPSPPNGATF
jgi:hypothetical protein